MEENEHLQLIATMYATCAAGDIHSRINYLGNLISTLWEWNERYKVQMTLGDTDKLQRNLNRFVWDLAGQIDAVVQYKKQNFGMAKHEPKIFEHIAKEYRRILDFLDRHERGEQMHLSVCVLNRSDLLEARKMYRAASGAYASFLAGRIEGAEDSYSFVQQCMERVNAVLYRNDILQMSSGDWIKAVEKASSQPEAARGKS